MSLFPRVHLADESAPSLELCPHAESVPRGYLGLGLQPVRIHGESDIGAMVMSVDSEGPAARAGIHQGDVIRSWEGKPIASVSNLHRALGPASVGATLTVGLSRGGEAKTVKLVVGERPGA